MDLLSPLYLKVGEIIHFLSKKKKQKVEKPRKKLNNINHIFSFMDQLDRCKVIAS